MAKAQKSVDERSLAVGSIDDVVSRCIHSHSRQLMPAADKVP
jgi:hypothetical protein